MRNVKKMVNVLLVATAFGAAYHRLEFRAISARISVFLTTEGSRHQLLLQPAKAALAILKEPVGYGKIYIVTATAYQAVEAQTDDEPFVTADNSFIKPGYSSKIHWLAISQDLLVHWGGKIKYGDQVQVRGVSPQLDGLYTVHDTMNKRHHHCIDILSNPSEKFDIFAKNVKIQRFNTRSIAKRSLPRLRLASSHGRRPAELPPRRTVAHPRPPFYLASAIL